MLTFALNLTQRPLMAKKMYPTLLRNACGEIGLSRNGMAAWEAGERPLFLWPESEREGLEPTIPHHVEITDRGRTRRALGMFYRKPSDAPYALDPKRAWMYRKRSGKLKIVYAGPPQPEPPPR